MLHDPKETTQSAAPPAVPASGALRRDKLRLGDVLVQQNLVTADRLTAALARQRGTGKRLGRLLIEAGIFTEEAVAHGLARQLRAPVVNLKSFPLKSETVRANTRDVFLSTVADTRCSMLMHFEGRRVTVSPATLQMRLFTVNHHTRQHKGRSEVRVCGSGVPSSNGSGSGTGSSSSSAVDPPDSSQITTHSNSNFCTETAEARRGVVGKGEGAIGQTSGNPDSALVSNPNGLPTLPATSLLSALVNGLALDSVSLPAAAGGTLGLSLETKGLQAVLGFLETHGDLQFLSSPRVATLNNQKAVLKVGTDEYFITNVSGGSNTPGGLGVPGTTTMPKLTLTPFFSGIALDVTPQIDDADMITLRLRPSVTEMTEVTKPIDLSNIGYYRPPLASSNVNETGRRSSATQTTGSAATTRRWPRSATRLRAASSSTRRQPLRAPPPHRWPRQRRPWLTTTPA